MEGKKIKKMLKPATLKFLKDLHKNNNRPWFEKNRASYEGAKVDLLSFVEKLIPGIAGFDKTIADQIAKNCTFRINRDVRFSQNKSPYKNNIAGYFNKNGKKAGTQAGTLQKAGAEAGAEAGAFFLESAVNTPTTSTTTNISPSHARLQIPASPTHAAGARLEHRREQRRAGPLVHPPGSPTSLDLFDLLCV